MISTNSQPNSPFESIKRFEKNNEFWYARELMPLLGYSKWQRFQNPIEQAIENLELNGDDVATNILPLAVSLNYQQTTDYKLSRYGCYMVALCCDGRKVEVATAKKYFAIKTHQAEIAEQKTLPTNYLDALKALVAKEEERIALEQQTQLQRIQIADLETENEQLSEAVDELFNYSSIVRVAKFNHLPEVNFYWRKLKAASIGLGLEIKQVPCPRFGTKNLYHHDAWRLVYPNIMLPETTTLYLRPNHD